jgi:hypothetical protein
MPLGYAARVSSVTAALCQAISFWRWDGEAIDSAAKLVAVLDKKQIGRQVG